jgi:hypothetical protein
MPTYHRSQRLRLVGTGPKVEQLQESRFRLTFTCTATNPNEAWMNGNKDQIMTDYGTLQSAQKNIAGIDPRTDEAYSDMVLFRTEANPSERDLIITLVYETATTSFVKSQDDKIDFELNGLQRVTRVTIAKTGTTLPSVTVGVTSIGVNGISCKLASRSVEENDAFIQITETYLQSGITDVREDIVGSQKAIVITKVGNEPTVSEAASKSDIAYDASGDWSIARKDVSQEGGLKIYNYTFLLDNTVLSQSQDKQSSLKTEVIEVFNPKVTIDGLTVEGGSTVAGNYFLSTLQSNGRNQYFQSQGDFYPKTISYNGTSWRLTQFSGVYATSTDTNPDNEEDPPSTGWSGTGNNEVTQITIREFDQTLPNSLSGFELSHRYDKEGYSLINIQRSNLDGIPTMRYTFAKDGVLISQSEEKVGSQLAIVKEVFNGTPSEPTGYVLASEEESNVDGIPTRRYRFLKEDVQLSLSVDNQSPLKTEIQEWFSPEGDNDRDTKAGYSLINQQDSNVQGIPTVRYTFAKNNVLLSVSEDKIGSQNAIVNEIFKPSSESITGKDTDGNNLSGYSEADRTESNHDGIKTIRVRFLKNGVTLQTTEDKVGSQLAIVKEVFNGTPSTPNGYSIADESISNVDGIPTRRFRFLKNDVVLSRSKDSVGSQKAVVLEVFNGNNQASDANTYGAGSGYVLAKEEESNVDGIDTKRYTYLQPSILSRTDDKKDPACPITIVAFDKDETDSDIFASENAEVDSDNYVLVSKTERDFEGIETFEMRFEKNEYFLSERKNEFGRIENVKVEQGGSYALQTMPGSATIVNGTASSYIIAQEITEGTVPRRTTTYSTTGIESVSEDLVGATKVITITKFITTPSTNDARIYSNDASDLATDFVLVSDTNNRVNGVDIFTYRFARKNAIVSTSFDAVGSQKAFVVEKFGDTAPTTSDTINGVALSTYTLAKSDESNVDGIKTFRYTFLKPSIISVAQDFVEDINTIQVTAFNKTEAQVKTDLSEVTINHKLISQRENNHDGIKTTTFIFEINTSDIIQFTADDRLQVTRTIYEAHDYNYDSNYTVGTSTATVNNTLVTLTSLRVDQRGTTGSFTKLTAVYTQPKIVTVSPIMTSQYNDVPVYQYRSIVSSAKTINTGTTISDPNGTNIQTNAVFFEPSINNNTSPSTFTQNVLNTSTDLSVANSSVLINSHDDLYNFLYPGVVRLNSRFFGRTSAGRYARIDIKTIKESYPTTTKVRCNVYNFIQRNGDIEDTDFTYDGASGLWSANSWATVDANITRGYFSLNPEPNFTSNVYTGYRMNGSSIRGTLQRISLIAGTYNTNVFYNGVNYGTEYNGYFYEVKITEPGPPDPVGRKWCLGVDIKPVFRDTSGNTYYNKQIIVTERIPIKQRGQVTYN